MESQSQSEQITSMETSDTSETASKRPRHANDQEQDRNKAGHQEEEEEKEAEEEEEEHNPNEIAQQENPTSDSVDQNKTKNEMEKGKEPDTKEETNKAKCVSEDPTVQDHNAQSNDLNVEAPEFVPRNFSGLSNPNATATQLQEESVDQNKTKNEMEKGKEPDTKEETNKEESKDPSVDQDYSKAPECAVCISYLCDPLTLGCEHSFCRVCLLQATFLAPDGRSCPLCRSTIQITSPATHPVDKELEAKVKAIVPHDVYNSKLSVRQVELAELMEEANSALPIFYMRPGTHVGAPVALYLFEPRYRILIRRVWEGNKRFIYCAGIPEQGAPGIVVQVAQASFLPDGQAHIFGIATQQVVLGETWIENNTGGLFHSRVEVLNRSDSVADAITTALQNGNLRFDNDNNNSDDENTNDDEPEGGGIQRDDEPEEGGQRIECAQQ